MLGISLIVLIWHVQTLLARHIPASNADTYLDSTHQTPIQAPDLPKKQDTLPEPGFFTLSAPVQLEAHIMSKCPDARDCILDQVVPAMSQLDPKIVNFTLSYIGKVSEGDDGVECMHGPNECLGNILQLCAAKLYPDPKQYLGFTYCTMKQYDLIPQRSLIQECAAEYGIAFSRLNDCASKDDGGYGMRLLRDSVERTRKAGVTKSCTVRVNETIWCVRDGGEWKECDGGADPKALVDHIQDLYNTKNGVK
ncbi:hypothetical protein BT63DRAFT_369913 [Microthyrium microscopicum]|uniref:Gamma interferon inducible lysosomal thiol reductase n=1 Tax=Microthyrium microscopicum TaxID=703497 RepID=A0A6A6UML4_9PEZI|nr:hypothetical protein BT63DRAFT_369913 [Microthyrium microscopicum]